ncbi:MAG: prolipoprotein diacylglyceryl transferase [Cyanobacteria bacterium RUI128]|nr:prolipoprotein diacylglyceryl transferase [Cyanobacteria bacterium RUI128]
MFTPPDCAYITVFGFNIYYYGIILAFAIFVGVLVSNRIAMVEYFRINLVSNIATSVILGGIIGARLYYCLLNFAQYSSNPMEIFALREGGLSIHGAILGGLIVLFFQAKLNRMPFLKLCDIFAMGLPLAQAIGRWGNFFNSEAFGLPTNLPWGLYVKPQFRPDRYFSSNHFHPAFLYESLLDVLIFLILYLVMKKYKDNYGVITAWYLILYSVVRFFIEYIRVDCVKYVFGVPFPQFISVLLISLSVLFLLVKHFTYKNVNKC